MRVEFVAGSRPRREPHDNRQRLFCRKETTFCRCDISSTNNSSTDNWTVCYISATSSHLLFWINYKGKPNLITHSWALKSWLYACFLQIGCHLVNCHATICHRADFLSSKKCFEWLILYLLFLQGDTEATQAPKHHHVCRKPRLSKKTVLPEEVKNKTKVKFEPSDSEP